MQGMVAGKRSRGKQRQRWEKDITDTFGTDGNSKQSGGGPASISQRHLGSDILTRICSEKIRKMNQYRLLFVCGNQYRLLFVCGNRYGLLFVCGNQYRLLFVCGNQYRLLFVCGNQYRLLFVCGNQYRLLFVCGNRYRL